MSLTTKNIKPSRVDVCRQILTQTKGNLDAATAQLVEIARADSEMMVEFLNFAARCALNKAAQHDRNMAFENTEPFTMSAGAKAAQDRARSASSTLSGLLMDMPVPIDGVLTPLRDCIGTDLADYAENEIGKAKTLLRRANFLKAVGATAGAAKIGSTFDEEGLRKLYDGGAKKAA